MILSRSSSYCFISIFISPYLPVTSRSKSHNCFFLLSNSFPYTSNSFRIASSPMRRDEGSDKGRGEGRDEGRGEGSDEGSDGIPSDSSWVGGSEDARFPLSVSPDTASATPFVSIDASTFVRSRGGDEIGFDMRLGAGNEVVSLGRIPDSSASHSPLSPTQFIIEL